MRIGGVTTKKRGAGAQKESANFGPHGVLFCRFSFEISINTLLSK